MVRTQLYLPDDMYKALKAQAKAQNMTFASYVRVYLEKEAMKDKNQKSLNEAYPFMKVAEDMRKAGFSLSNLTNEDIDNAVYGF